MTLLTWLGSKLECGISDKSITGCAQTASGRADRSIHGSIVKLMEPAPPG
jgi:hypothetical protein